MSRSVGGTFGILMVATALASAQEGGPPLTPPALEPSTEAPSPPPAPKPTSKPAARRPFLVIPGVNTPARSALGATLDAEPSPVSPPPLAGPGPGARSEPTAPTVTIPLTLEPIPEDDKAVDAPSARAEAPIATKPRAATTNSAPVEESGGTRHSPGSMLGRLLGFGDGRDDMGSAISVESKADPAVDAAVKRRIEKAVKESLGDRASAVQVRVKGRTVLIQARASRFWHRRGVRRVLDSFRLPSGYHGRAELID